MIKQCLILWISPVSGCLKIGPLISRLHCIYVLQCLCPLLYVGEKTTECRLRINNHKSTIRWKKVELPAPQHFFEARHKVSDLRFSIIDHVPPLKRGGNREKLLKRREVCWIKKLDTMSPCGMNLDYPLTSFFVMFFYNRINYYYVCLTPYLLWTL